MIALRAFLYLRARGVPLQRVRKAVAELRQLGETKHLSSYRLVAVGKDVARVPYDLVAALLDDGVAEEDVATFYPSVPADAARGAREFARYVDEYRERVPA